MEGNRTKFEKDVSTMYAEATSSDREPDNEVYNLERVVADRIALRILNNLKRARYEDDGSKNKDYNITKVVSIALARFSELEIGESISVREIKKRLGEIKKAGFDVKSYSSMNKEEAWNYLHEIRIEIRDEAKKTCPELLERVLEDNERRKREAPYYR